jgi:hypothetical protein
MLEASGFAIIHIHNLNKVSAPPWYIYSRLLRRRSINKVALKASDKTVWFWRRIDAALPWKGLSLIVVARRLE